MKKYIDLDKAIAYVGEQYRLFGNDKSKQAIVAGCIKALKFVPTAENVAEVVCCKDCRYRKTEDCAMYYKCECGKQCSWETACDYCSMGKRIGG